MKTLFRFLARLFSRPVEEKIYTEEAKDECEESKLQKECPELRMFNEKWMI